MEKDENLTSPALLVYERDGAALELEEPPQPPARPLAEEILLFRNGRWLPHYFKRLFSRGREFSFLWFALSVWLGVSHKKRQLRRQVRELTRLHLIDPAWYRAQYHTMDGALLHPALHYLRTGARAYCNPNPLFSTRWFVKRYAGKVPKKENPLLYYLRHGVREGLNPCSLFDTRDYLARHPELERTGVPPLSHYLATHRLTVARGAPLFHDDIGQFSAPPALKKNVVYVSGEWSTPGHHYRVMMYAKALADRGYNVKAFDLFETPMHTGFLETASAIVLWRAAWDANVELIFAAAKRTGAKVVFDVDDLMIKPELAHGALIDSIRFNEQKREQMGDLYGRFRKTASKADFCASPTRPLTAELRKLRKPGFVLPNGFDEETYLRTRRAVARRKAAPSDGLIRIGYAGGTRTHQKDFACASEAIAQVLRAHPECRLVLFRWEGHKEMDKCLDPEEFPEFAGLEEQIEWWPFRPLRELPDALARFDINLAPLEYGNEFCEAKSELKFFEAALAEVPTIASPTEPYAAAIRDGETGFLARDPGEWAAHLETLIAQPEERQRMGRAAFDAVYWKYGPERRAQLAGNAMEQILGDPDRAAEAFQLELLRPECLSNPAPAVPDYDVVFEAGERARSAVAVIVPVYNYARFLEEALDSVLAQTLPGKDLVVVDDGSTDGSLEVALAWLRRNGAEFGHAALLKNKVNSGLAAARNAAFAFTDALYCLPLDADNVLNPACLERCLEKMTQTGAAAVYPVLELFGECSGKVGTREWIPQWLAHWNYVDAMALIRRSVWAFVGGYRPMHGWEDYDFWCRLIESGLRGENLPEVLAKYRVHGTSMLRTETNAPEVRTVLRNKMLQEHPWLDLPKPK